MEILYILLLGYGLPFGLPNWVKRITSWVTGEPLHQSELGTLLDYIWVIIIIYLIYKG